jgi:MoaA/NifB/PqqE/SkfB family radical SAM enzyme
MMQANPAAGQLPYLGIRFQIKYHKCNLDCPYCIADWKNQPMGFDAESFRQIITRIKELPYRVSLRIGMGGELLLRMCSWRK